MVFLRVMLLLCALGWDTLGIAQDTIFFRNGRVAEIGELDKQGLRQGRWVRYQQHSKIKIISNYLNGVEEGPYTVYNDTVLTVKGTYVNGLLEGDWVMYFNHGPLLKRGQFIHGKAEGLWETFDEFGQLERKEYFKNDARHGEWKQFFNNRLRDEGRYENNLQVGTWRRYHENGQLAGLSYFKNGAYDSLFLSYNDRGALLDSGLYRNGKREGFWKVFGPHDTTFAFGHYKDDHRVGQWREYYLDGKLKTLLTSEAGPINTEDGYRLHGDYSLFDKTGLVKSCLFYWHGKAQGTWRMYFPNGCEEYIMAYEKGELRQWLTFYPTGFLKENRTYVNNQLNGLLLFYYPNGQLQYYSTIEQGLIVGMQYEWWPNGHLKKYGPTKNGRYHGHWKIYNEDGSLYVEGEYVDGVWNGG